MPIIKSAKKALRVGHRRENINDLTREKVKSAVKAARLAISANEKSADEKIKLAYRELDIAAKKNVIHKNKASRLKSRLAKRMAKVEKAPSEKKKVKDSAEIKTPAKKTTTKKTSKKPSAK
ncbi:MAG: small subunit ribosomal protein S20 [Candidatus Berkelbacteria bacterium Athens1014_28]|uniref:Small ribosomal subunit protein bS20 n=1 Tax=Candidatus Berkelbacteria bacterium Athens1014_28 TaxID=2017145 RepID=A0A554LLZ0_9BACT|nr:MAG: small subunit ribosomal protein S20 [Candidatus Berkelbacteria bacterium Athens1014_28]